MGWCHLSEYSDTENNLVAYGDIWECAGTAKGLLGRVLLQSENDLQVLQTCRAWLELMPSTDNAAVERKLCVRVQLMPQLGDEKKLLLSNGPFRKIVVRNATGGHSERKNGTIWQNLIKNLSTSFVRLQNNCQGRTNTQYLEEICLVCMEKQQIVAFS